MRREALEGRQQVLCVNDCRIGVFPDGLLS